MPRKDPSNGLDPEHANGSADDLTFIRAQLMKVVRDIAIGLDHSSTDLGARTLALSRLLDRIRWLDQLIDHEEPEPVAEIAIHDYPGWLRVSSARTEEHRAAEEAEIARRRAWAESQIGDDEFWGLNSK